MSSDLRQYDETSRDQFIMKLLQRRVACTHIKMTRLFDPGHTKTCDMCYKVSPTGWLYCCVQDHNGFLPDPGMLSIDHNKTLRIPLSVQDSCRFLSASIRKGIQEGNYCEEQVQVLVAQKRRVKDVIEALEDEREGYGNLEASDELQFLEESDPVDESSDSSSLSTDSGCLEEQSTSAVEQTGKREPTWADEVQEEKQEDTNSDNAAPEEEHRQPSPLTLDLKRTDPPRRPSLSPKAPFQTIFTTLKPPSLPLTPPCLYKCCPRCRPAYRDRAAQPIDEIVLAPTTPWPPPWDLANRPVSNALALQQGGPLPSGWELYHPYQNFEGDDNAAIRDTTRWGDSTEDTSSMSNTAEADVSTESDNSSRSSSIKARSRWGIRRSVRHSLNTLSVSLRLKPNTNINDPPPPLIRRFLNKRRRPMSMPQALSQDISAMSGSIATSPSIPMRESASERININPYMRASLALLLAINTPLPGAGEDECTLAGGEVEVDEVRVGAGVAVKEEAMALGVPDLITQV